MRRKRGLNRQPDSLRDLRPGQSGVVTHLDVDGALKRRFIDMGITPGVRIYVVKEAPLGDPIEINLRGYELSIRKSDAFRIKIMLAKDVDQK